nr:basic proline-rich protein-like [Manis javanica]
MASELEPPPVGWQCLKERAVWSLQRQQQQQQRCGTVHPQRGPRTDGSSASGSPCVRGPARRPEGSGVAPVRRRGSRWASCPSSRGGRSRACHRGWSPPLAPFGARARPPGAAAPPPVGVPEALGRAAGGAGGRGGPRTPGREAARLRAGESLDVGNSLPARPAERRGRAGPGAGTRALLAAGGSAPEPPPGRSRRPGGSLPAAQPPLGREPATLPLPPRSYLGERPGAPPSPAASGRCVGRESRRGRTSPEPGGCPEEPEGERAREREPRRRPLVETRRMQRPPGGSAVPSRRQPPNPEPAAGGPGPPDRAPPPPGAAGLSSPRAAQSQETPGGAIDESQGVNQEPIIEPEGQTQAQSLAGPSTT